MSASGSINGESVLETDAPKIVRRFLKKDQQLQELSKVCKAVSEPIRMRQLFLLFHALEIDVTSMREYLHLGLPKQPLVSHHLAKLKSAELTNSDQRGRPVFHYIRRDRRRAANLLRWSGLQTDYVDTVVDSCSAVMQFDPAVEMPALPSALHVKRAVKRMKACSDVTRLRIICILLHYDNIAVEDICAFLNLAQPGVSEHLRVLRRNGEGAYIRKGKYNHYHLGPKEQDTPQHKFEIASMLRGLGIRSPVIDHFVSLGPPEQERVERTRRRNDVTVPDLEFEV